jgi:hypothetical protein
MAFVKLYKGLQGSTYTDVVEVRMGAHRTKGGRTIYVSFTQTAAKQAGWTVENRDKRTTVSVRVDEGTEEDAGFLLLSEDPEGYVFGTPHSKGHAFSTNLLYSRFKHYVLNDDAVPVEPVEFTIDEKDHTILIQCPEWLRYNPQSVAPIAPQPKPTPPPPPPPEPPLPPAAREDKKPSRPTVRLIETVDDKPEREIALNRQQRRKIVSTVTRAMR